jgi:hypothetical protein
VRSPIHAEITSHRKTAATVAIPIRMIEPGETNDFIQLRSI